MAQKAELWNECQSITEEKNQKETERFRLQNRIKFNHTNARSGTWKLNKFPIN